MTGGDLREAVHVGREGNLVLFAVDASGSMAARQRMRAAKGAVLSLLLDAYQRRDKVGLVTFRADHADLVLPPTSSVEAGARRLQTLATGGRTPLAAGLAKAAAVLAVGKAPRPCPAPAAGRGDRRPRHPGHRRRPGGAAARRAGTAAVVVDCETGLVRLGLARRWPPGWAPPSSAWTSCLRRGRRPAGRRGPGRTGGAA